MIAVERLFTLLFAQVEYYADCNAIVVPILSSNIFKTSQLLKMLRDYKDRYVRHIIIITSIFFL